MNANSKIVTTLDDNQHLLAPEEAPSGFTNLLHNKVMPTYAKLVAYFNGDIRQNYVKDNVVYPALIYYIDEEHYIIEYYNNGILNNIITSNTVIPAHSVYDIEGKLVEYELYTDGKNTNVQFQGEIIPASMKHVGDNMYIEYRINGIPTDVMIGGVLSPASQTLDKERKVISSTFTTRYEDDNKVEADEEFDDEDDKELDEVYTSTEYVTDHEDTDDTDDDEDDYNLFKGDDTDDEDGIAVTDYTVSDFIF